MNLRCVIPPIQEREWLFYSELIKAGVDIYQAICAAQVLASGKSDEQLSPEEAQCVKDACDRWLTHRKRTRYISQVIHYNQCHLGSSF